MLLSWCITTWQFLVCLKEPVVQQTRKRRVSLHVASTHNVLTARRTTATAPVLHDQRRYCFSLPFAPWILPVRSKNRHREQYPLDQAEKSTKCNVFEFSKTQVSIITTLKKQRPKIDYPHDKKCHVFAFSKIRYHYHITCIARPKS